MVKNTKKTEVKPTTNHREASEELWYQITPNMRFQFLRLTSTRTWGSSYHGPGRRRVCAPRVHGVHCTRAPRREVNNGIEPVDLMLQVSRVGELVWVPHISKFWGGGYRVNLAAGVGRSKVRCGWYVGGGLNGSRTLELDQLNHLTVNPAEDYLRAN